MYTILTVVYGYKWIYEDTSEILQDAIENNDTGAFHNPYNGSSDKTYAYFGIDLDDINTLEAIKPADLKLAPNPQHLKNFAALWAQLPPELQQAIQEASSSTLPEVWIIPSSS
jgi:hypothetical protein